MGQTRWTACSYQIDLSHHRPSEKECQAHQEHFVLLYRRRITVNVLQGRVLPSSGGAVCSSRG